MKKRRIATGVWAMLICFTLLPVQSAAADIDLEFSGISFTNGNLVAHAAGGNADLVGYMIHDGYTLVNEGYLDYRGGDVKLSVPAEYMKSGSYKVTVWGAGSSGTTTGEFNTFDVQIAGGFRAADIVPLSTPAGMQPGQEELTAVKTPQAVIYSDRALTRQAYTLKQYDRLFYKETPNPLVHYVYGYWIDGEPDILEGGGSGGYDIITNTVWFDGYMYANSVLSHSFGEEIPKEVVNLAHSRLGLNGVYSQHDRWGQYSQDCSSFVYWVYREFGIRMGATTADSEMSWLLQERTPGLVVWNGAADYEMLTGRTYYNASGSRVKAVKFGGIDANIIDELEPGDVIYFNWHEDLHYYDSEGKRHNVRRQVNEGNSYGVDHTGLYIGEGKYIHAAGPGRNTIISPLAADLKDVVFIGRPAVLSD